MSSAPRIENRRLLVDGRPTLLLAGELHNSSASTAACMASRWEGIAAAGCDTVLASVAWEQFEPAEGRFDATCVDALLEGARAHGLRLVLLWFGSWKNGVSSYVPPWVKADTSRFGVQHLGGRPTTVLSPFVDANATADARAFAAFMAHLRRADEQRTVVMVQIENEVGSLGDSRDRSPAAEKAWAEPVPEALLPEAIAPGATWLEAFGDGQGTDELFMAWHLATYVERIAAAGRAEHDLPLFVNAWLNAEGDEAMALAGGTHPGTYPSGGPLPHVAHAWHTAAPTLDFLAPDIYASDPEPWLAGYESVTPAIFVPELHRSAKGLETIFLAVGSHGAIGTAPFGIDELTDEERHRLGRTYRQLGAIADDILEAQSAGTIRGFVVGSGDVAAMQLGDFHLAIRTDLRFDTTPPETGYGLILALGPDEFVVAGHAFMIMATTLDYQPAYPHTVHELALEPRTGRARDLPVLRWLNGDETLGGTGIRVTGDEVLPWPGGIPSSGSITGLVRFSLLGQR